MEASNSVEETANSVENVAVSVENVAISVEEAANSVEGHTKIPKDGMKFDSEEDLYNYFKAYAF